jgi:hypothetical protein
MLVLIARPLAGTTRFAASGVSGDHPAIGVAEFGIARVPAGKAEGVGGGFAVVVLALEFTGRVVNFADGEGQRVAVLERPGAEGAVLSVVGHDPLLWFE